MIHPLHKYIQDNGLETTLKELDTLADQGYLYRKVKNHLILYKYTQQCVTERNWNTLTRSARGIIYNVGSQRLSYALSKFFNHLEETAIIPPGEFEVYDKVDGSLIHFFYDHYDSCWRCCTPGSLDSEQSIDALAWAQQYLPWDSMLEHVSYLFEWISPDNRIVVDYNNWRGLILLAAFNNNDGMEFPYKDIPIISNDHFRFLESRNNTLDQLLELAKSSKDNMEGWVLKWPDGYRLKIKTEEYVRLHRLVTGITFSRVYDMLSEGISYEILKESIPNEFYAEYDAIALPMIEEFNRIRDTALNLFKSRDIMGTQSRKEYAEWVKQQPKEIWSLLFLLLDNRPIDKEVWKIVASRQKELI